MSHYWLPLKLKQREFTPEILQEIGSIVICWADVEDAFDSEIDWLSKLPEVSALIPPERPVSFKMRLTLWRKMARAAFNDYPEFLPKITAISSKAQMLGGWRNALNHGHLKMQKGDCVLWVKKYVGNELTGKEYTFPTTRLKVVAANIRSLHSEILALTVNRLLGVHRIKVEKS